MRIKFNIALGLLMMVFAGQVLAAKQGAVISSFAKSTSLGNNQITVHAGGDIDAVHSEPGIDTNVSIRLVGHVATITTDNGISTNSSVVDLDAMEAWLKAHPDLAYDIESAQVFASRNVAGSLSRSSNAHPMANACGAELSALLDAADRAVSTCSMGGGIMCALATGAYGRARDAYNLCMGESTPAQ